MFENIYNISNFYSPNKILLGAGAAGQIADEALRLGAQKVIIVTDRGLVENGLVDNIQQSLRQEKFAIEVYDQVELEPPVRVVDDCAETIRKGKFDLVVGLGGGSALDTAKGASLIAANNGQVLDYIGQDLVPEKGIPKILIPTTAGSGAEVTRVFAVTDETDNKKKVVYSNFNLPDVVILDPLLTVSLPPKITAETGIDALAHAIESYVSFHANHFSDMLARKSIELISRYLPVAFAKGEDLEARYNTLFAANLAGLSFSSGGLGAVHALSYILETEFHLPHALATSIMLPHVMSYNLIGNLQKYADIAAAMGDTFTSNSLYASAQNSVHSVKTLLDHLGISAHLSDHGVTKDSLQKLVEGGMNQARLFIFNPRNPTREDVENIYLQALN